MKIKPRTLKDLKFDDFNWEYDLGKILLKIDDFKFFIKEEIKEEAKKWIKYWRDLDSHCPKCDIWAEKHQDDLMHFFNITEEELK